MSLKPNSLLSKLDLAFKNFDMICIWDLDNNPRIYIKDSNLLTVLMQRMSEAGIDIEFVQPSCMPAW